MSRRSTAPRTTASRSRPRSVSPAITSGSTEQWARFGATHRDGIGDDVPRYLPWLLDELPGDRRAQVLAGLKPEVRTAYETEWQAACDRLTLWSAA